MAPEGSGRGRSEPTVASRRRPLVVAHRGAWDPAPQNSLEAFERAIELGCDAVELDVRRTADRRLVVVHDARAGGRTVRRLEHRELQIRLGSGYVPTLDEALEVLGGEIAVDVEIKEEGYEEDVMRVLERRLGAHQYVVTSFRPAVLPAVKLNTPEARTGLLIGARMRRRELERRVRVSQADFLAPHFTLAGRGLLAWATARELPAWVWTVNDGRVMRRLGQDPRVAALITDRPLRALELAGRGGPAA